MINLAFNSYHCELLLFLETCLIEEYKAILVRVSDLLSELSEVMGDTHHLIEE